MENTKMFRQVTDKETSTNKLVDKILKSFRSGETKILTAKRILDQGVDIPQTKRAYVLASNTIERQWTQRRGRILRKCHEINKEFAEIFDFVILPFGILDKIPEEVGKYEKKLISLELPRIKEFSRLSRNKIAINGSSDFILKLEELCAEKDE
jgi:superfamily II DNA or RNA helicase